MASILNVDQINNAAGTSALTIDASGNVNIPGHVVQVVQYLDRGFASGSKSNLAVLSSATFVDIMSKSITTTTANSKILVQVSIVGFASSNLMRTSAKVFRDSTEIDADAYAIYGPSGHMSNYISTVLDSPSAIAGTTITYKMQANANTGSLSIGYGDSAGGANSNITLMEIAQ